jgi:hypothetical protein
VSAAADGWDERDLIAIMEDDIGVHIGMVHRHHAWSGLDRWDANRKKIQKIAYARAGGK